MIWWRRVIQGFVLAWIVILTWMVVEDHFRLIQVRQQLMDRGTPIQMDDRK